MFSPVAGNMIRSLFLNRLRADREWAPPDNVRIERVSTGPLSTAAQGWSEALAKSKLPQATDAGLPEDTIELLDGDGARHRVAVCDLTGAARASSPSTPIAVLSPKSAYGRVVEIVGANDGAANALARLAVRFNALPYRTPGPDSVLLPLKAATTSSLPTEQIARSARACRRDAGDAAPHHRPRVVRRRRLCGGHRTSVQRRPVHLFGATSRSVAAASTAHDMIDRQWIGFATPPSTIDVDRWQVRLFCQATGETNALHWDDDVARDAGLEGCPVPPTFLKAIETEHYASAALLRKLGVPVRSVLHAEQSFEYLAPVHVGDALEVSRTIADAYDKKDGALGFIVVDTQFRRADTTVCTSRQTIVVRQQAESR